LKSSILREPELIPVYACSYFGFRIPSCTYDSAMRFERLHSRERLRSHCQVVWLLNRKKKSRQIILMRESQ
jgi:hypothetical protein